MDKRHKIVILVESEDLEVIRNKIFRDYGFVVTDEYIKDLIAFVQDMMDQADDRNLDI
jgi:hypothetical protein